MTETEYVETIRAVATAYRDGFRKSVDDMTEMDIKLARRWECIKSGLAASTAIELCEAWLEKHKDAA